MRGFMGHRPIPLPGRRSNSPTNALQPGAALFRVHRASCASAVLPHALGWSGEEVYPPEPQGGMENPWKSTKQWESCIVVILNLTCCLRIWDHDLDSFIFLEWVGTCWNHWHGNGGADSVPATFQDSGQICPSQIHISCCWSGFVCPDSNFQLFSPIFSSCSKNLEPFAGARTVLSREGCMFGAAGVPWSPLITESWRGWLNRYPWISMDIKGCSPNHWVVNFRTPDVIRCWCMVKWLSEVWHFYMVFVFGKGWISYHLESFIRELSHSKIGWDMKQHFFGNI